MQRLQNIFIKDHLSIRLIYNSKIFITIDVNKYKSSYQDFLWINFEKEKELGCKN